MSRPNSGCLLLCWHGYRRFGSAQLRCLGAPTDTQLRWGGWATPWMLRIYAYPTQHRELVRGTAFHPFVGGLIDWLARAGRNYIPNMGAVGTTKSHADLTGRLRARRCCGTKGPAAGRARGQDSAALRQVEE